MELKDVRAAAIWIAKTDAKDAEETCAILGISRARLSQLMSAGDIIGRQLARIFKELSFSLHRFDLAGGISDL